MTVEYLLIDDLGRNSRKFKETVSLPGRLEFVIIDDLEMLQDVPPEELAKFDGAIVDFHLNPSTRPGYRALFYEDPELFPEPVQITTGMGVFLYLRKHAPGIIRYGLTESSNRHAPFFLCAAFEWCGAEPLNVAESSQTLREVLLDPDGEKVDLQTWHPRMMAAIEPFKQLMDSALDRRKITETYDWLRCYRECAKPRPHVQLKRKLPRILGVDHGVERDGTYTELMRAWQAALAAMVTAWGGDVSGWPDITGKVTHATWGYNNPVLDYVREPSLSVFFTAADVRAALTCYRNPKNQESP